MASGPFDSFGQNGANGVFSRVNLAQLAVKRGLKGGTLKQSLITYGHWNTRPGVLYKPMVHIYPISKGCPLQTHGPHLSYFEGVQPLRPFQNRTQFDYKSFSLRAQVHSRV